MFCCWVVWCYLLCSGFGGEHEREGERESGIIFALFVLLHSLPHDYDDYLPCCCCSLFSLFSNFVSSSSSSSFVFAPSLSAVLFAALQASNQQPAQLKPPLSSSLLVLVLLSSAYTHTQCLTTNQKSKNISPRAKIVAFGTEQCRYHHQRSIWNSDTTLQQQLHTALNLLSSPSSAMCHQQ